MVEAVETIVEIIIIIILEVAAEADTPITTMGFEIIIPIKITIKPKMAEANKTRMVHPRMGVTSIHIIHVIKVIITTTLVLQMGVGTTINQIKIRTIIT